MSRFLHSRYQNMEPYTPGEQPQARKYIKLNTNESPYAPSPRVLEAINRTEAEQLRLYSDPEARALVNAIAHRYGVDRSQVMVGNGSDEILAFCYMAFGERGFRYPQISYGFYPVFAETFGVDGQAVALKEDFTIDIDDYKNAGRTVLIANPNAPTGICLSRSQVEEIVASNPDDVVIVDEAYVDFGGESSVGLLSKYDNLVVVQTFSKSRNLAGARLGFALTSPELAEDLNKMKFSFNPYNVNRLSIVAGAAAMEDEAYFQECTGRIRKTREKTAQFLSDLGFTVLPSSANFLFVKPGTMGGTEYFTRLREEGSLVRHWSDPRIVDFVRVTIGSEEEMERFCMVTKILVEG